MPKAFIEIKNDNFASKPVSKIQYDPVNKCPVCKAKISPVPIYAFAYEDVNEDLTNACVLNYCTGCHSAFITTYLISINSDGSRFGYGIQCLSSEPNRFVKNVFDERIISLSPQFDKIYNQALAAESSGLDEIAGLGYRKALEFLIKDYATYEHPEDTDEIKSKPFVQCIKSYIKNEAIVTLAERSAWIGNDEAHYIRKQEDRDISDMKSFIQAIVYFIGMVLITEDAASMSPKK